MFSFPSFLLQVKDNATMLLRAVRNKKKEKKKSKTEWKKREQKVEKEQESRQKKREANLDKKKDEKKKHKMKKLAKRGRVIPGYWWGVRPFYIVRLKQTIVLPIVKRMLIYFHTSFNPMMIIIIIITRTFCIIIIL